MGCRKCIVEFLPVLLVTFLLARVGFHDAASAAEPEPALIVRNVEGRETKLTLSELAKLSRVTVRAKDEKGSEAVWEGTALHEVLKAAGMNLGEATRGAALANYLIAEAADGYRVVFALPEVDPAFTDFIFLLADRRNAQPIGEYEGRWRIVVPHEKRHARWVRKVVSLTLQRLDSVCEADLRRGHRCASELDLGAIKGLGTILVFAIGYDPNLHPSKLTDSDGLTIVWPPQ